MPSYIPYASNITKYPSSIVISIVGNFSMFTSVLEEIDMHVYMSLEKEPKESDLTPLDNYRHRNTLTIDGRVNDELARWRQYIHINNNYVKYELGTLEYRLQVDADQSMMEVTKLATYPLFRHREYYIFMYLRFKVKGGDWMPLNRTPATHYLRCRYKLVRNDIEYGRFGNYTVTADDTTITTIN